jgi:nucleoside-diphosphate-sugar epimerase
VIRSSYNVAGVSFNPRELAAAIRAAAGLRDRLQAGQPPGDRRFLAEEPGRQPRDGSDWGWKARIGIEEMVADMLENIDVGPGLNDRHCRKYAKTYKYKKRQETAHGHERI